MPAQSDDTQSQLWPHAQPSANGAVLQLAGGAGPGGVGVGPGGVGVGGVGVGGVGVGGGGGAVSTVTLADSTYTAQRSNAGEPAHAFGIHAPSHS